MFCRGRVTLSSTMGLTLRAARVDWLSGTHTRRTRGEDDPLVRRMGAAVPGVGLDGCPAPDVGQEFGMGVQLWCRHWLRWREENQGGVPRSSPAVGADGEEKKTPTILFKMQVCQKSSGAADPGNIKYPLPNPIPSWTSLLQNSLLLFLPLRTSLCSQKKVAPKPASFSLTVLKSFIFHYPQRDFHLHSFHFINK